MPERLPHLVSEAFLPHPPRTMAVAVSGGSDSLALLYLLNEFCGPNGISLHAVTVNHQLRPEASEEAAAVARHCWALGVPHDTLVWEEGPGRGNLQKNARDARYDRIAAWASERGIDTVALGHTADDQAETFLMRLARRAGVDGLSGMRGRTLRKNITWVRPLLDTRRETLRRYLRGLDVSWIDDPSNEDERFERVKARRALEVLADLGIDADVLGDVADQLADARRALEWQSFLAAKRLLRFDCGAAVIDETALRLEPDEVQRRVVRRAITWIGQSEYGPRRGPLSAALAKLRKGQAATLAGCHIRRINTSIWIFREFKAVADTRCDTRALWDGRWRFYPQPPTRHDPALHLAALGEEGLAQCPDWRATGKPHTVLQSTPAVWRGEDLVSAPLAGYPLDWQCCLEDGPDAFFAALLSH